MIYNKVIRTAKFIHDALILLDGNMSTMRSIEKLNEFVLRFNQLSVIQTEIIQQNYSEMMG